MPTDRPAAPSAPPAPGPVLTALDPVFRVNNFDLLRILAAAQVVLGHSQSHLALGRPWFWGLVEAFPGVPVFFALSGYLISASFERSRDLRSYARNRLLRILPGLWSVVLLTVVVTSLFGYSFLNLKALVWLPAQMVGLIYTPGFLKSFGFGSYNGALWTIPIELQFYVVLPLVYVIPMSERRRTQLVAAALAAFSVVTFFFVMGASPLSEGGDEPFSHKVYRYSFIPHIDLFLTGVLLQRLRAHRSRWITGKALPWLAVFCATYFGLHQWLVDHWTPARGAFTYVLCTQVMAVTVIACAFTMPRLSERLLRGNDLSYGVYIYHGLVIGALLQMGLKGAWWQMGVVVAITFVVAMASWRLVEKPFLRRKKNALHAVAGAAKR